MRTIIIALLLLTAGAANAQSSQPLNDRIGAQIGALVIQNAGLQVEIEHLNAEIKRLKDEAEKKPDATAKEK